MYTDDEVSELVSSARRQGRLEGINWERSARDWDACTAPLKHASPYSHSRQCIRNSAISSIANIVELTGNVVDYRATLIIAERAGAL